MRKKPEKFSSLVSLLVSLGVLILTVGAFGCTGMLAGDRDLDGGTPEDAAGPRPRRDLSIDRDAFWAQDPPPMYCALDGGMLPPPMIPGGTPECPDDKNREGCPCTEPGATASCWPGLRKNRGLGICQDGTTKCLQTEDGVQWDACVGYTLPLPGQSGAEACECFSAGLWALENVVPCFLTSGGTVTSAVSTELNGNSADCPANGIPTKPWSPNKLTVDCAGRWTLCYALKAGDAKNPQPSDCEMIKVCTKGDYTAPGQAQPLPALPKWETTTAAQKACAAKFYDMGGYGEMSVDGQTVTCDKVIKVFKRVNYCPSICNEEPDLPECKDCTTGGSGGF